MERQVGDVVIVKINGKEFETVIEENGNQSFRVNKLFRYLVDNGMANLNTLTLAYQAGLFSQEEFMLFNMGLGHDIDNLAELSAFEDLVIENPLRP